MQFRFGYFTAAYEATIAFYRDDLGLNVVEAWDRDPNDRGTLFQAASGIIEVLARPSAGASTPLWDDRPPQGAFMVIQVPDVDATYRAITRRGLSVQESLSTKPWGHRSFCLREPNGLTLYIFSDAKAA